MNPFTEAIIVGSVELLLECTAMIWWHCLRMRWTVCVCVCVCVCVSLFRYVQCIQGSFVLCVCVFILILN
jgi:hypothetical protein